jgi:hypothetical protein
MMPTSRPNSAEVDCTTKEVEQASFTISTVVFKVLTQLYFAFLVSEWTVTGLTAYIYTHACIVCE